MCVPGFPHRPSRLVRSFLSPCSSQPTSHRTGKPCHGATVSELLSRIFHERSLRHESSEDDLRPDTARAQWCLGQGQGPNMLVLAQGDHHDYLWRLKILSFIYLRANQNHFFCMLLLHRTESVLFLLELCLAMGNSAARYKVYACNT